ncbi:MAG: transglycosylase SLT domain-containing protein [Candidatus Asgardarchaeia archaeon]
MNWYKKAQMNKEAKGLWTAFGFLAVPAIALLLGVSVFDIENRIKENPQELTQQVQQAQQEKQAPQEPQVQQVENAPINIDINKIWGIESSSGQDPNMDRSKAGARGHFQFLEKTWNEMMSRMGKNWDWWNGSMDYNKSSQVADYYLNQRIPQMLKYYNIPDNIETRLGSYDWGIGNVKNAWEKYGEDWIAHSPTETQNYILLKYK